MTHSPDWFTIVTGTPNGLNRLSDCLSWYEDEYKAARIEVGIKGYLERDAAKIPGIVENRFSQLQELEAILCWVDLQVKKEKTKAFKKYLEVYNRALSSRDALLYAEGDSTVLTLLEIYNQVCFMRNKFLSIMKGLSAKEYQINNITKLRHAGLEETYIDY